MRRLLLVFVSAALLLALRPGAGRAAAGGQLLLLAQLTAAYDGADVRLDWAVTDETDVDGYDLYRRMADEADYRLVRSLPAAGLRHYRCLDPGVFHLAGGESLTYRLVIRRPGLDQSQFTVLAGAPSAVQRSWGTIKEMFQ